MRDLHLDTSVQVDNERSHVSIIPHVIPFPTGPQSQWVHSITMTHIIARWLQNLKQPRNFAAKLFRVVPQAHVLLRGSFSRGTWLLGTVMFQHSMRPAYPEHCREKPWQSFWSLRPWLCRFQLLRSMISRFTFTINIFSTRLGFLWLIFGSEHILFKFHSPEKTNCLGRAPQDGSLRCPWRIMSHPKCTSVDLTGGRGTPGVLNIN